MPEATAAAGLSSCADIAGKSPRHSLKRKDKINIAHHARYPVLILGQRKFVNACYSSCSPLKPLLTCEAQQVLIFLIDHLVVHVHCVQLAHPHQTVCSAPAELLRDMSIERHVSHKHSTLSRRFSLNASVRKAALEEVGTVACRAQLLELQHGMQSDRALMALEAMLYSEVQPGPAPPYHHAFTMSVGHHGALSSAAMLVPGQASVAAGVCLRHCRITW